MCVVGGEGGGVPVGFQEGESPLAILLQFEDFSLVLKEATDSLTLFPRQ